MSTWEALIRYPTFSLVIDLFVPNSLTDSQKLKSLHPDRWRPGWLCLGFSGNNLCHAGSHCVHGRHGFNVRNGYDVWIKEKENRIG